MNVDNITNENNKEHKEKWPYIPDHPYRILIIGGSVSLLNLISQQDDIDKIYLYAKDVKQIKISVFDWKAYKNTEIKHLNGSNAFIECSNTIGDVPENTDDYNPNRKKNFNCVWWHDCRHNDK